MSDNDRKNPHEMKQDHEHHDPLERLTRIFNPNRQSGSQNDQSSLQTSRSIPHAPETSSHDDDDFDLSFLEEELKNDFTDDLAFDDQKKQWNLDTISNEPTQNIAPAASFTPSEQNNSLSKEAHSSPMHHDEEEILDALSPLPIQKSQSFQNRTAEVNTDPFFEKSEFSAHSENFFFNEIDKHDNNRVTTENTEQANRFSQTTSQQTDTPNIQQNYDDNQNFYGTPVNHSYKVSADQENFVKEYYSDVSPSSTEDNMLFSSSGLISEKKYTAKNETTSDFPSALDSAQINKQSDLKNFLQEDHTSDYPEFYEKKSSDQETYTEKTSKYHNAQGQYTNNAENNSDTNNEKKLPYGQSNLNDPHLSSETLNMRQTDSFFSHNYTHRNTPPPNVDTYKFAEEIVEKTGPIMVPEVPYEAPEYDVQTDSLKEEFADVLNVGNVPAEGFSLQQQQNEVFNEIFHQTVQNPREDAYKNPQNQNTNHFPTDNMGYNSSSFTENSLYKGADKIPTHDASATPTFKSFIVGKTLPKSIVLLVLMAICFVGYSHFFMPSQKNETAPIIHADNTPFKFRQETTEMKNDIAHNLDVYKQTTGQNGKQENTQKFLIDNSEQPEDLPELNQQESTNFSSSSLDESDVEDAVTEATNHTIPTREVQTVIVNQDGTVSLLPMHHKDKKTADNPEETIDQTAVDELEDSHPVFLHDSDTNNKETENNFANDIDEIIAKNTSNSGIEGKAIPIPSHAERNSEVQTHAASRPTEPSQVTAKNSESYYVQIASQPTHALARDSLKNMKSRFGFLIGSRPLNIQSAFIPGKGTYYRVRIQMQNRNEAITLCENIKSFGGSCFIAR
ncbi:SPOR domain-containing protein [Bartonella sp. B12(2025)]